MDLSVPNQYRRALDIDRLELAARRALEAQGLTGDENFTLKITTDKVIRKYNQRHRQMNEATDVLSFENAFQDPETGEAYLGDILISIETAARQAEQQAHPLQEELEMLLVHGLLHLNGFDHLDQPSFEAMSRLQDQILRGLSNPLLGSIHAPE